MSEQEEHQQIPFIRKLCTHLSEEELIEAEARFWRYVDIVRRIHEREQQEACRFDKDAARADNDGVTK